MTRGDIVRKRRRERRMRRLMAAVDIVKGLLIGLAFVGGLAFAMGAADLIMP